MKKILQFPAITFILCLLITLGVSCKKEKQLTSKKSFSAGALSDEESDALVERVEGFYADMKNIRDTISVDPDTLSTDSTEFLIEATYNYYCARLTYDYNVDFYDFEIIKTFSNPAGITLHEASVAFYEIKDELIEIYDNIDFSNKSLAWFDLEITTDGSDITYKVKAGFVNNDNPTYPYDTDENDQREFNPTNGNYVWATHSYQHNVLNDRNQLEGTYTGTFPNPSFSNGPNLVPGGGAAKALELFGRINYFIKYPWFQASTQKFIVSTNYHIVTPFEVNKVYEVSVAADENQYSAAGVSGYDFTSSAGYGLNENNGEMWQTWTSTSTSVNTSYISAVINDNEQFRKEWLTKDMMNYYLRYFPDVIHRNMPSGFKCAYPRVSTRFANTVLAANTLSGGSSKLYWNPMGYNAVHPIMEYEIHYGVLLDNVYLPNGYPIPNM